MTYAVTNPATGETVKTYDTITDAELEAAIAAADEAHRTWSKSSTVEERAALIRRVAELHTERRKELAQLIVREMGKPMGQAVGEVDFAAAIYADLHAQGRYRHDRAPLRRRPCQQGGACGPMHTAPPPTRPYPRSDWREPQSAPQRTEPRCAWQGADPSPPARALRGRGRAGHPYRSARPPDRWRDAGDRAG